jgi:hypothetical protein
VPFLRRRRRGRKAQKQADELLESRFRDRMVTHLSMAPLHGLASAETNQQSPIET